MPDYHSRGCLALRRIRRLSSLRLVLVPAEDDAALSVRFFHCPERVIRDCSHLAALGSAAHDLPNEAFAAGRLAGPHDDAVRFSEQWGRPIVRDHQVKLRRLSTAATHDRGCAGKLTAVQSTGDAICQP